MAKELKPKDIEALEATYHIQFRFSVANGHFSTGLVERRMRSVHDYIGKLKTQGSGMSTSDMSLMFQFIAHVNLEASNKLKVNSIILLKNINN